MLARCMYSSQWKHGVCVCVCVCVCVRCGAVRCGVCGAVRCGVCVCVCVGGCGAYVVTYNIELLLDGVCPQVSLQFDLSGPGVDGEEVWSVAESNDLVGRLALKDQQTVQSHTPSGGTHTSLLP